MTGQDGMSQGKKAVRLAAQTRAGGTQVGLAGRGSRKEAAGLGVREEWVGARPALPASLTQCHAVESDASQRHAGEEPEGTVDGEVGSEGCAGS